MTYDKDVFDFGGVQIDPEIFPASKAATPVEESKGRGGLAYDLAGGAVRGAGSIGATLLFPVDWLAKKAGIDAMMHFASLKAASNSAS